MNELGPVKGHTAMSNMAGDITKKAYDRETFTSLMECCSRLFFCDEEIVIIDLFLAVEKAISEKDMEDELGIADSRLREHLCRLERHGILSRFSNVHTASIFDKPQRYKKDMNRESISSQSFWKINNRVLLAIHYKLSKMEEILQQRIKGLYESDKFVCPKCESMYDSLTVQTLEIDGFDAHFICRCGTKVELDDKSTKEDIYSSQQKRFEEQVKTLKKCLFEAWGMEVPEFPVLVKKDEKGHGELNNNERSTVAEDNVSVTGGGSSVVSDGSMAGTQNQGGSVSASEAGTQVSGNYGGRTDNKKIKFHMKVDAKDSKTTQIINKPQQTKMKEVEREDKMVQSEKKQEEPDEIPDFYISKLNKKMSLIEAQKYQQHMTNLEFEVRFDLSGEIRYFIRTSWNCKINI